MTEDTRDLQTAEAEDVAAIEPGTTEVDDPVTEILPKKPRKKLRTAGRKVERKKTSTRSTPTKNPWRELWRALRTFQLIPVILIVLIVISGGVTTWLYFKQYRADKQTDPSVAQSALAAASEGTVALLSYSPDTLDKDFETAKSHLAGDFLSYYDQFTQQIVAPAAKQKALKTTARVVRAAVYQLQPDSAVVLVFVDQSTTSKDSPDPAMAASSVLVSMIRVNGKWLITKFNPV